MTETPAPRPRRQRQPKTNGGEDVDRPQSHTDVPPRATATPRRPRKQPGHEAGSFGARCSQGHEVAENEKFCHECGSPLIADGPLRCRNGHEVSLTAKFCSECGTPVGEQAIVAGETDLRPRPDTELSEAELAERQRAHDTALRLGRESPTVAYARGHAPAGVTTTIIHFLVDGFTVFGNVWMRGQEIELWPGHPRWNEAQAWINRTIPEQYKHYGRQVFGYGPWPGAQSYTAGLGRFENMRTLESDPEHPVPLSQPTAEELAAGDAAERRRGRRVPLPIR